MLESKEAVTMIGVKNLIAAKAFYGGTLGLQAGNSEEAEVLEYRVGSSRIWVYKSQYGGTNQATTLSWVVGDDLDRIVAALKARQVVFEHYDMPGTTREGDIHVAGDQRVAWFKDPDGNILSLVR